MPQCAGCGDEYPLDDLYCSVSGRGANSTCETHDFQGLYCDNCLIQYGMDKLREMQYPESFVSEIKELWKWVKAEFHWRVLGKRYEVRFTEESQEAFNKLPKEAQDKIMKTIDSMSKNPFRRGDTIKGNDTSLTRIKHESEPEEVQTEIRKRIEILGKNPYDSESRLIKLKLITYWIYLMGIVCTICTVYLVYLMFFHG